MTTNGSSDNWTDEEVENYLSHLSEAAFKNRTPEVVYHSAVITVGVTGNSLVLLVYGLRFRPSAPRTFVLVMAVLDLIINVVTLPLQIASIRHAYDDNTWRCRLAHGFSTISTPASGVVLVLVALDRFRRVCAPLKKQLNSRQAFYLSLACVFFMMTIFGPFIPCGGVHRVNTTQPGVQARMCWFADEYKDTSYSAAYKVTAGTVFFAGLVVLVVSYTGIGIKLWRRRAAKKTQSVRLQQVQENRNVPETAASGTVNTMRQENTGGREDPRQSLGGGSTTQVTAAVHEDRSEDPRQSLGGGSTTQVTAAVHEDRSENTVCDSTSTENRLSNSASFNLEMTTLNGPEQAETTAEGNESERDTRKHPQSQTECGASSRQDQRSRAKADKERSDTMGQDTLATRRSVPRCLRRVRSRTTLMMAVLTSVFIINWLPNFVVRAILKGPSNLCDNFTDCGSNIYPILLRSVYLNSAVNAFVYSFCNERFQYECRRFFRGVVRKLSCRT